MILQFREVRGSLAMIVHNKAQVVARDSSSCMIGAEHSKVGGFFDEHQMPASSTCSLEPLQGCMRKH